MLTSWFTLFTPRLHYFVSFFSDGFTDLYEINYSTTSDVVQDIVHLNPGTSNGVWKTVDGAPTVVRASGSAEWFSVDINRIRFGDLDGNGLVDVYCIQLNNGTVPVADTMYLQHTNNTLNTATGALTFVPNASVEAKKLLGAIHVIGTQDFCVMFFLMLTHDFFFSMGQT